MDGQDSTRAADSDREALAERLRVALNEGRLDLHEYDERLRQTYAARTYAELDRLVADLPGGTLAVPAASTAAVSVPPVHTPVTPAVPSGVTRRWLVDVWGQYLTTVALVVTVWGAIAIMDGGFWYFWPGWVAGPWGAVLLVQTVTGLLGGEPTRWAAKQERRRREREARKIKDDDEV